MKIISKILLPIVTMALSLNVFANEPTKLIVPVAPGGLVDNLARFMATEISKKLKENIIVENKPGASGSIATSMAAAAAPNGQTLIIGNNGTINMYPILNPGFDGYGPKSLTPVCLIGGGPLVLTAASNIPANNFKELLQYFKENPDKATWASPGIGTAPHLLGEQLKIQYNLDSMVHILYRGMALAQTDVIGNRVSLIFDLYNPRLAELIKDGKLKPIFVTDNKPIGNINAAPDASFYIRDWFGLFTVSGTPEPILSKLRSACDSVVNDSAAKEQLSTLGAPTLGIKPGDAQQYIDNERKRWIALVSKLNLKENK